MQLLITGFLVSLALWAFLSFLSLKAALKLYRDGAMSAQWLLLVPYLFASLVFYGIRYRFAFWVMDRQSVHELFSIGAWEADKIVFFLCIPLFYVISVLRPQW